MSLESKNYVASPTDVEKLTRSIVEANRDGAESRASYLRALIATTQDRLGISSKRRQGVTISKTSPTERDRQLEALQAVHELFYEHVKRAAMVVLREANLYNAIEHNRRTNFARSSMSTLRKWVKSGNDITNLVPARTSKGMLAVQSPRKQGPSPHILLKRALKATEVVKAVMLELRTADASAANAELVKLQEWTEQTISKQKTRRESRLNA